MEEQTKSINLITEEFKNSLYSMVNNANLPFSVVYYVFKDFMKELTDAYTEMLKTEMEQYNKEQKNENDLESNEE